MLMIWAGILPALCAAQQPARTIVHFDFDKFAITNKGKATLDSILHIPALASKKIQLFGHTDAIGNNSYNDQLSVKRVNTAKNYLTAHGLPAANIVIDSGFGKRMPLNKNADKAERQANRRVEIIIIEPFVSLIEKIKDSATHPGTNIVLKNLNFIGNKHEIMKESWPILLDLLSVMRKYPALEIEIQGHVCCTGGKEGYDEDEKALILSSTRAFYVYKYLIDNGVSPKRLSWKAFGNSRPLFALEDTPEKRMQNRRVEIRIVKK
jgi:outer membrane protein OmpA-like peptidoglycan-associated protein